MFPLLERYSAECFDEKALRAFPAGSMPSTDTGDVIDGMGCLRKLRLEDERGQQGKCGSIRFVYCWWSGGAQFWLFMAYGKDVQDDLSAVQKNALKSLMDAVVNARKKP